MKVVFEGPCLAQNTPAKSKKNQIPYDSRNSTKFVEQISKEDSVPPRLIQHLF